MDVNRAIVFVSCLALSFAAVCDDVDTKACELMATKMPNLCSDTCLSKMCTRFCGHCPVKCYQCSEVYDPANCTNMIDCPSKDHYCYTTQTFADDFTEVYKMGCAMKSICQQYLGPENKRNIDVNGACCTRDGCNNKLPLVILTEEKPPTPSTLVEVNTTADPSVCENLDDTACNKFVLANPAACSETCFATNICPRLCGKCFNCYTCNDIEKINGCNVTNVCHAGHECFTLETLSFDLRPVFRVGCMEENLCAKFKANAGNTFGRRDGFSLKGGCCKGDLCNDHIETYQATTSTPAPTTSNGCHTGPNHCPDGFHSLDGRCYRIGTARMTWQHAKSYCESHCARLVDFSSRRNMDDVFTLLVPHHHNIYQDTRVWTDATYSLTSRHWIWNHSGSIVDPREFRYLAQSHHRLEDGCGFAVVHTSSGGLFSSQTTTEDVEPDRCTSHHLPLCETGVL